MKEGGKETPYKGLTHTPNQNKEISPLSGKRHMMPQYAEYLRRFITEWQHSGCGNPLSAE